jgi:hypothetical protein
VDARLSCWLFALGIVGTVLALGGVYPVVVIGSVVVFGASSFFAWREEKAHRLRPAAKLLLWVAIGLTGYTALQALPLPRELVAGFAPTNGDIWARALSPLGAAGPRWVTLSVDPIATRVEVLRGVLYISAFLAALRIARERDGQIFLERLLVASAVILALTALLHPAFAARRVFGVYTPVYGVAARHIAPLLNANHLAAYLNIGICLSAAAALTPRWYLSRGTAIAATVLLVGTETWVSSRGGVGSMILGLLLVALLVRRSRDDARERTSLLVVMVGAVVLASVVLVVIVSSDAALTELSVDDLSKLQVFTQAMGLVKKAPLFGFGRGAFATVFPLVRSGSYTLTYTHPENIVAQWTTEWGVPVAISAFVVVVYALRPSVLFARSRPPLGAWAAIACIAVHNLVDFSSEVPGVVVALVTCAALVVGGGTGAGTRSAARRWRVSPLQANVALAGVSVLAIGLGAIALGHGYEDDGTMLRARVLDAPRDREGFHLAARAAMLRHPAEPYLPFLGGLRALTTNDEPALPWLAATLERAPLNYAQAHLLLARSFFRNSPAQARLEYRLAYLQDPTWALVAAREAAPLVRSYDDARELAPDPTPLEQQVTQALAQQIAERLPASAARMEADLAMHAPPSPASVQLRLRHELDELEDPSASGCETNPGACVKSVEGDLAQLRTLAPDSCATDVLEAEFARTQKQDARASKLLDHAVHGANDAVTCLGPLITLAKTEPDTERAAAVLDRVARLACEDGDACEPALLELAGAEEAQGHLRRARGVVRHAAARDSSDALLLRAANLASTVGMHAEALQDFQKLSLRHPEDARWAERMEAERSAVFSGALPVVSH